MTELMNGCRGIDDWERYVETDPQFLRPAEVDLLIGDASKARQQLGWKPRVQFEELVDMMVESDLHYVASQTAKGNTLAIAGALTADRQ